MEEFSNPRRKETDIVTRNVLKNSATVEWRRNVVRRNGRGVTIFYAAAEERKNSFLLVWNLQLSSRLRRSFTLTIESKALADAMRVKHVESRRTLIQAVLGV